MWRLALSGLVVGSGAYAFTRPAIPEDFYLSIEEKAAKDGYKVQKYEVETEDGFILSMFRLPKAGGKPLLLLHGFACGPETFIFNFYAKPLAYRLSDAGFDVWLGSSRGNVHSRRHKLISADESEFWDWTTTEMAKFDVPSFVDAIVATTKKPRISVLGHSQGGTMTLMALENNPSLQAKISSVALLSSPPARIPSLPAHMKVLTSKFMQSVMKMFGVYKVLEAPSLGVIKMAHYFPILSQILVPLAFNPEIYGDKSYYAAISCAKSMGGTSLKNLEYVRQLALPRKNVPFAFDFGPAINTLVYHQPTPAEIDFSATGVPAAYYAGKKDDFVCEWEMTLMKQLIGNKLEVFKTDLKHDHLGLLLSGDLEYVEEVVSFLNSKIA